MTFHVGDAVTFTDSFGESGHGCLTEIFDDKASVCIAYADTACLTFSTVDLSTVERNPEDAVECVANGSHTDLCQGPDITKNCSLNDQGYNPRWVGEDFITKEQCEQVYDTKKSTWASGCNKMDPNWWTLACTNDEECGDGRKCVPDRSPAARGKVCTCESEADCRIVGGEYEGSEVSAQGQCSRWGTGTMKCPKP